MTDTASAPVAQFPAKIVPELESMAQPLGEATPHPDNIRKHDLAAIARSLDVYGQRSPIVVQKSTGYIVKGNGTWAAAQKLGWDRIAMSVQDIDQESAMAYLIADNKASDRAKYDRDKTVAALKGMLEGPGLFDTLWEVDELEDLIAEQGVPETPVAEFKGGYADEGTPEAAERQAKSGVSGTKMKEIPVVLTLAEHAAFVDRVRRLQKAYGTSGVIATIVEAVRRESEGAENALPVGDAEKVRVETLRAARDFFLTAGKQSFPMAEVAAFFQSAMRPIVGEVAEEPVAEGQVGMDLL